ncbi:SAM-dependent methyltransferase [Dethiosulfatarculus sandiegensis]|uniref:Ribosomal RNA large subunit methyltransferase E n=1 Tax=Dethiosulfatarculus sandiegensis TaxID=1429043 RepID=A0A0D2IXJ4_9BACT|nr:RlmE family RNA methyltransferase [Dethiosulfatarculus sandiegensis]KIX10774.1 50S rRNA methyltransferase [Dethiosulfatarculus sandiegensis]
MTRSNLDNYYHKAKKEGYAARSIYKLEEIDRRYHILKSGMKVVDLGCHPGSWMQYVSRKVGPKGLVVGVDIQPLAVAQSANTRFIQTDLFNLKADDFRKYAESFDLILSDAAPRTTGVHHADVDKSVAMAEKAFDLARELLKPGGGLVTKVFFGAGTDDLIKKVKIAFKLGKAHKPSASKSKSKEIYLLGMGLK